MLAAIKAFLAGFKTYFYGTIVVVVIACSVWYTVHERHIGEQKILVRDQKIDAQRTALAKAATALNAAAQALAQKKSDVIGETYEKTVAAPVVDPPHVLCYRPAPADRPVSKASGDKPGAPGAAVSAGQDPVDIGPPLDTIGRDADAQINALIDEIQVLVDEMNGKTK